MTPRRRFRPVWRPPPLDPDTFVRRLATKLGSAYGETLTRRAFDIVRDGEDAMPWLRAVQRSRDAGALPADVAWFLLFKIGEESMLRVTGSDPELFELEERIVGIERAHGLKDLDSFRVGHGPPEWEAATKEWERIFDARLADVFRSIGEEELALLDAQRGVDERFDRGREAIFGPLEGEVCEDEEDDDWSGS